MCRVCQGLTKLDGLTGLWAPEREGDRGLVGGEARHVARQEKQVHLIDSGSLGEAVLGHEHARVQVPYGSYYSWPKEVKVWRVEGRAPS